MKRSIATLVATIMLLNFVFPNIHFVYATPTLDAPEHVALVTTASSTLLEGGLGNTIPTLQTAIGSSTRINETLLSWQLSPSIGNAPPRFSGTFVLEYFIADHRKVRVFVTRQNTEIEVTYHLINTETGDEITDEVLYIFNLAANLPADHYVRWDNTGLTPTTPGHSFEFVPGETSPTFQIVEERGFSFRYAGTRVSFLWQGNDFFWLTDSLNPGFVFEFNLRYFESVDVTNDNLHEFASEVASHTVRNVVNGIRTDRFVAIPLSPMKSYEEEPGVWELSQNTLSHFITPALDGDLLDPDSPYSIRTTPLVIDSATGRVDRPGGAPADVIIRFDLPLKQYNGVFSEVPRDSMRGQFTFTHPGGSDPLVIIIPDIFQPDPDEITVSAHITGVEVTEARLVGDNDTRVHIYLSGLQPSTLYAAGSFSLAAPHDSNYFVRSTALGSNPLFTFLEYNIVALDNRYYISFVPYRGHTGTYELFLSDIPIALNETRPSISVPGIIGDPDAPNVLFPLAVTATGGLPRYYQIVFSPAGNNIPSQMVSHRPDENDLGIGSPRSFQVLDYRLDTGSTVQGVTPLDMTLRWNIASVAVIHRLFEIMQENSTADEILELSVEYAVNATTSPTGQSTPIAHIEAFIQPNDGSNAEFDELEEFHQFDPDLPESRENPRYFIRKNITFSHDGEITEVAWEPLLIGAGNEYSILVELSVPTLHRDATYTGVREIFFESPNIYFLNVELRAIVPLASTAVSITLDDVSDSTVPTPQALAANSRLDTAGSTFSEVEEPEPEPEIGDINVVVGEVAVGLSWELPGEAIRAFLNNMFGANIPESLQISTNIYISTDEHNMVHSFSRTEPIERESMEYARRRRVIEGQSEEENVSAVDDRGTILAYVPAQSNVPINLSDTWDTGVSPINALRNSGIVMIEGVNFTPEQISSVMNMGSVERHLTIHGLDPNQRHYVYADIEVTYELEGVSRIMVSPLSNLVPFTTVDFETQAGAGDRRPSIPEINVRDVSTDAATIYWRSQGGTIAPNARISSEYEMVRVRSVQMPSSALNHDGSIAGFIDQIPVGAEYATFRTNSEQMVVQRFNSSTGDWEDIPETEYEFELDADVAITDISLSPNQIYYYYVRAVRTVTSDNGNVTVMYSGWNHVSVTTLAVQAPINLIIDRSNRDEYDAHSEMILAFDAPITNVASLGTDFIIQYSIRREDGTWSEPITMTAATLIASAGASAEPGHVRLRYMIRGLTHGTGYSFRVRMIDADGSESMWSNTAEGRTEIDRELDEEERELEDWLDHLRDRLAQLMRDPFWYVLDTANNFTVVYRSRLFDDIISSSASGNIPLVSSGQNANVLTYYIPAASIIAANNANRGFSINTGTLNIIIPPQAFDTSVNPVLRRIVQDISAGDIADYYVRMTVTLSNPNTVDGRTTASQQVNVSFAAVGSLITNVAWDSDLIEILTEYVAAEIDVDGTAQRIVEMIRRNAPNAEILAYIDGYVERTRDSFMRSAQQELDRKLDISYVISELNRQMTIVLPSAAHGVSISAAQNVSNTWITRPVVNFGIGGFALSTNDAGTFVFVQTTINVPGVGNLQNSHGITSLIARHGLQDFLGVDAAFNINANATSHMVAGIVARIAGAPRGADPFAHLRSMGLNVSTRNQFAPISNQEAIHMLMFLYEVKTNTRLDSLTIRNFAISSQVTLVNERYRRSIQVALQEGFVTNTTMNAAQPATVEKVLDILGRLNSQISL